MIKSPTSLTEISFDKFKGQNVSRISRLFSGCSSLTKISFDQFEGLEILDISNFKTSQVPSLSYWFDGCKSLTSINLGNLNTDLVGDMQFTEPTGYKETNHKVDSINIQTKAYKYFDYTIQITYRKNTNKYYENINKIYY